MGISIHYRGEIKEKANLRILIEEVTDIAKANGWEYFIFDDQFPEQPTEIYEISRDLFGITVTPPGSEDLSFCFLDTGEIIGLLDWMLIARDGFVKKPEACVSSVKTQYGGAKTHKTIVDIVRYIAGKYLVSFEMTDEASYWETGDELVLEKKFKQMGGLLDSFEDMLTGEIREKDESTEEYIKRLAAKLHDLKSGKDT